MATAMRERAVFVSSIVLCVLVAQARPAKDSGYAYRASVEEVRLTFVASDRDGRNVRTLTPADVAVVDNGIVVRDFRSFNRSPQLSLRVMVLLDASGSVAPRFRQELDEVSHFVGDSRWKPADTVSVLSFGGGQTSLVCERNCRGSAPVADLSMLRANGLTPLYDAIVLAGESVAVDRDPSFRNVLVAFSDGADTISRNSLRDVIEAAQRTDTMIYAVDLNNPKFANRGASVLQTMASATGGQRFSIDQGGTAALTALLEDARSAYVLTYQPATRSEGSHSVRICPTRDLGLHFRCRQAYYYENDLPSRSMP